MVESGRSFATRREGGGGRLLADSREGSGICLCSGRPLVAPTLLSLVRQVDGTDSATVRFAVVSIVRLQKRRCSADVFARFSLGGPGPLFKGVLVKPPQASFHSQAKSRARKRVFFRRL